MKFTEKNPPRQFTVGTAFRFKVADCGSMALSADEQITFTTEQGGELDVTRKDWGFYATPSLNGRLAGFGLRPALIRNRLTDRYFVVVVETGHDAAFDAYLEQESCEVVAWLDTTERLTEVRRRVSADSA